MGHFHILLQPTAEPKKRRGAHQKRYQHGFKLSSVARIAAAGLFISIGSANAAQMTGNKSITMPIFGDSQSVNYIWRAGDGNIFFEFFYKKGGHAFADFFDTHTGKRLFPDRAEEMANSPGGALQNQLRPKGLKKVATDVFSVSGPNNYSVSRGGYEGGSVCGVQYSSPIKISGPQEYQFAIYAKLAVPRINKSGCGGSRVHLNYDETSISFISADKDGFWVLLGRSSAVARFDWRGKSTFFNGRADPVLVPYSEINNARKHVEDRVPTQAEYRNAERVIQEYSRLQITTANKWTK